MWQGREVKNSTEGVSAGIQLCEVSVKSTQEAKSQVEVTDESSIDWKLTQVTWGIKDCSQVKTTERDPLMKVKNVTQNGNMLKLSEIKW